jgi:hypothetical protein
VRLRDGLPTIVDGPYAGSEEQLAGFLTIDVESERRAVEIASRWPDAGFGAMEVRAVMTESGTEM